jgi:transposase InsO family protein
MASFKHHQRRLISVEEAAAATRSLTPEQRLLVLDAWQRSGLPASDFAPIAGVSKQALYAWKRRFAELGPAGLVDGSTTRAAGGSKLPAATRRAIVMLKKANPDWGCQRISDVLYRGPGLAASESAVSRVLKEEGYVMEESPTRPHEPVVREFERASANQLWQTDLFTFMLKRQNRRVYLVAFMDDYSRYVVGYGLHASQSAALVLEVFRAAVNSCGAPKEVLTDNGAQYVTWRGTSRFAQELCNRGVRHIKASPHRPQTLGKVERFWGTLWRECVEPAIFLDMEEARRRIGLFIDYYNFQRPHQGIARSEGVGGLAPADRYFGAAPQTLAAMRARVHANALEFARGGIPRDPFYITGQVGGKPFSVHAEGDRVVLIAEDGVRREVDLTRPDVPREVREAAARTGAVSDGETAAAGASGESPDANPGPALPEPVCAAGIVSRELDNEEELPPGLSGLDEGLRRLRTLDGAGGDA